MNLLDKLLEQRRHTNKMLRGVVAQVFHVPHRFRDDALTRLAMLSIEFKLGPRELARRRAEWNAEVKRYIERRRREHKSPRP